MLIIADDLTGAADCGITCVAAGLDTVVVLKGNESIPSTDVVSVDAATRRLPSRDAAEQTARLTRRYLGPQTRILFKKLDSTLRGHVAHEIAAVLSVSRALLDAQSVAIVAPAFPEMGRTTVGGRQFVRGVPVEATEIWHREPVKAPAYLPGRLGEHGLRTAHIDLPTVRSTTRLSDALAGAKAQHDAVVCDAETEEDLRAIVCAGMTLQTSIVWAGSAALAAQLSQSVGHRPILLAKGPTLSVSGASLQSNGPLLFVIGSPSQASRQQIARLAAHREMESVAVPPAGLRHGAHSAAWAEQTRRLDRAFATGRDMIVWLEMEDRSGVDGRSDGHEDATLSPALAALVSPYATRCSGLILTGGETARSVLDGVGVATLRLVREVEPGIPLSVATVVTPAGSLCLPVVTKAGAFGAPHSLLGCHDAIRTLWTLT
jgi:D-threonate/D-erythronate kinase